MDGDSGLEHSADEVDLQEYSENNSEHSADTDQDDDLNGTLPEVIFCIWPRGNGTVAFLRWICPLETRRIVTSL